MRQAGEQPDDARDVVALRAFGIGAAQDDVLEQRGVEVGALEQAGDDLGRQRVGANAREGTLAREVERGTGIGSDDGFHDGLLGNMMIIIQ